MSFAHADVLLTHGYFLAEDEKERQIMKPYPPLGLLYLSAYLKRAGFAVEVFDSTFGELAALAAAFRGSARRRGGHLHQPHDAAERAATSSRPRSCTAGP